MSSGEIVEGPAAEDEAPGPWGPGKPAPLPPCSGEWGRLWLGLGGPGQPVSSGAGSWRISCTS